MEKANAKQNKKIIALILMAIIIICGSVYAAFNEDWRSVVRDQSVTEAAGTAMPFEVHFIDVGQGDCILIECDNENMLIDCGENAQLNTVKRYLTNEKISAFKYVVATHAHSDHIGGMADILDTYEVDTFIMSHIPSSIVPTSQCYLDMLTALKSNNIHAVYAKTGTVYNLGGAEFTIIGPVRDDYDNLNNTSVVIRLSYGKSTFLFQGDAEKESENDIINSGADMKADILKVGHHGSSTASTDDYLTAVGASDAVISVGNNNQYGHPAKSTVKRLNSHSVNVYRTDVYGSIVYSGDKEKVTVRTDK